MKVISKEHFERMEMMSKIFGTKSKSNPLYLLEYKVSKKINQLINDIESPKSSDFKIITDLINNINKTEHHNGSQWLDYKIHLNAVLRENGFDSNIA